MALSRGRKTFSVEELKEFANKSLARTDSYATGDFKSGVCTVIERVLMDSGNYNGFRFLDEDKLDDVDGYFSRHYF